MMTSAEMAERVAEFRRAKRPTVSFSIDEAEALCRRSIVPECGVRPDWLRKVRREADERLRDGGPALVVDAGSMAALCEFALDVLEGGR